MLRFYTNFTSMKSKLGLIIGISTFLISTILIAYTTISARSQAIKAAQENAMAIAKDYAGQVKTEMEKGLTASRIMAQSFSGIHSASSPIKLSREEANTILKQILVSNESFYSTNTVWEPNAFDQQDEAYKNFDAAHDTSGRFIPYWFKENGQLLFETTAGYDKGTYYTIPKTTKAETIIDPISYTVNGSRIFLITITAPILNNNKFYGVAGVDIALDWMQKMVSDANLYDGKAKLNIISHSGVISASTESDTLIGKNVKKVFPDYNTQIADLERGAEGSILSDSTLKVHAPIYLGNSNTPWQVSITIPSDVILAEANAQMWKMILISGTLLILSLAIILYIVQKQIKPLDSMVRITKNVAEGDLSYQEIKVSNDEIGQMSKALAVLMEGLRKTTAFANQIGKGNLEAEFTALGEKDVLGNALISMRDNLKNVAEEDKKRNWLTEGLARFGDILRNNHDDIQQLSENVIINLVKYLEANQGVMFVITEEGDEVFLEQTATYAWDRKRYRQSRVPLTEGLAGQAVLEKDYIYLTDVPKNYISITSGLGHANPTSILIMPIIINDVVMGVIEIASFKRLEPYQIEFISKIGESIASTLSSVKITQTTRRLLEEARLSTEEKRAAEEELLQNQEELQATQEGMKRTMEELRKENTQLMAELLRANKNHKSVSA
jgi:methyl-accepting chemotaxis protein